jgi:prepilin-type N-terminal cleavage/methylation domain-containing protein
MKKAFTLIELLVAVGILAIMVSFSGVVFRAGIESNRVASANAEIMRNLRAITDQLNSDFKGARNEPTNLPLIRSNEQSMINGSIVTVNSDRIALFANGDFQTTKQYNGKTVW